LITDGNNSLLVETRSYESTGINHAGGIAGKASEMCTRDLKGASNTREEGIGATPESGLSQRLFQLRDLRVKLIQVVPPENKLRIVFQRLAPVE